MIERRRAWLEIDCSEPIFIGKPGLLARRRCLHGDITRYNSRDFGVARDSRVAFSRPCHILRCDCRYILSYSLTLALPRSSVELYGKDGSYEKT